MALLLKMIHIGRFGVPYLEKHHKSTIELSLAITAGPTLRVAAVLWAAVKSNADESGNDSCLLQGLVGCFASWLVGEETSITKKSIRNQWNITHNHMDATRMLRLFLSEVLVGYLYNTCEFILPFLKKALIVRVLIPTAYIVHTIAHNGSEQMPG